MRLELGNRKQPHERTASCSTSCLTVEKRFLLRAATAFPFCFFSSCKDRTWNHSGLYVSTELLVMLGVCVLGRTERPSDPSSATSGSRPYTLAGLGPTATRRDPLKPTLVSSEDTKCSKLSSPFQGLLRGPPHNMEFGYDGHQILKVSCISLEDQQRFGVFKTHQFKGVQTSIIFQTP